MVPLARSRVYGAVGNSRFAGVVGMFDCGLDVLLDAIADAARTLGLAAESRLSVARADEPDLFSTLGRIQRVTSLVAAGAPISLAGSSNFAGRLVVGVYQSGVYHVSISDNWSDVEASSDVLLDVQEGLTEVLRHWTQVEGFVVGGVDLDRVFDGYEEMCLPRRRTWPRWLLRSRLPGVFWRTALGEAMDGRTAAAAASIAGNRLDPGWGGGGVCVRLTASYLDEEALDDAAIGWRIDADELFPFEFVEDGPSAPVRVFEGHLQAPEPIVNAIHGSVLAALASIRCGDGNGQVIEIKERVRPRNGDLLTRAARLFVSMDPDGSVEQLRSVRIDRDRLVMVVPQSRADVAGLLVQQIDDELAELH